MSRDTNTQFETHVDHAMFSRISRLADVTPKSIGTRIRDQREELALSLHDVALLLGRSRKTVQHWEVGDSLPPIQDLVMLAKHLDADPLWLTTGLWSSNPADLQNEAKPSQLETRNRIFEASTATPMQIGARIRIARLARDLSLTKVGSLIGKTGQAVQHWEVGNSEASLADLIKLSDAISANPIWIIFGLEAEFIATRDVFGGPGYLKIDFRENPAAAKSLRRRPKIVGNGVSLLDDIESDADVIDSFTDAPAVSDRFMVTHFPVNKGACFAFVVKLNSNAPYIRAGDLIVVDMSAQPHHNAIVVARIGGSPGQVLLGRLEIDGTNAKLHGLGAKPWCTQLGPFSQLKRKDEQAEVNQKQQSYIVGVAIHHSRNLLSG